MDYFVEKTNDIPFAVSQAETYGTNYNYYHCHDYYELLFIDSPGVKMFINERTFQVEERGIFFLNNYDLHRALLEEQQFFSRKVIAFMPKFVRPFETKNTPLLSCFDDRPKGQCNYMPISFDIWPRIAGYYHNIFHNYNKREYGFDVYVQTEFINLLIELTRMFQEKRANPPAYQKSIVPEIILYIKENIGDELNIETISKEFFISNSHLCRIFKNYTNVSIGEFIIVCRIMEAKKLLLTGMTVKEAGEAVGYSDISNFIRSFKKHVGQSPKQYMLQYSNKNERNK